MNSTFTSRYKLIEKIGEGSFSEVLKCEDKLTQKCYAAKCLKKVFNSAREVEECAEIIAMSKLSIHANIVYMLEFHYDPKSGRVIFIFELMNMSMYDLLKLKKRRRIPEIQVRYYLYQILKGLDHLHKNGLFHRDIKPENILLKIKNSNTTTRHHYQNEIVKLADFGSIRGIYSKPPYTEYISTRWYRSPECLLTVGYYGPKMDVWATGCVFYELLMSKPLFPGSNEIDQLSKIHTVLGTPSERTLFKLKKKSRNFCHFPKQTGVGLKQITNNVSDEAFLLLQLMIQYDPDVRINVRRLLDHNFFKSLREDELIQKYEQKKREAPTCSVFNKSFGDFHLPTVNEAKQLKTTKFKSSISRSNSRIHIKLNSLIPKPLVAKTTVDVTDYRPLKKKHIIRQGPLPLVNSKQIKSWGVDPNIIKAKETSKIKPDAQSSEHPLTKYKALPHQLYAKRRSDQGQYSKTISNLPQISTEDYNQTTNNKQFQSKSFVLPRKCKESSATTNNTDGTLNPLNKIKRIRKH